MVFTQYHSRWAIERAVRLVVQLGVAFLVCLGPGVAEAGDEGLPTVEVVDGDTLEIERPDGVTIIHLWGVDAPELGQKWGDEARAFLQQAIRDAVVEVVGADSDARELTARVRAADRDLSAAVVDAGYAWLPDTGDTSEEYATLLFVARSSGRGMWVDGSGDLLHPALWVEQNKPEVAATPVPEPTLNPLTRYAKEVALEGGTDGEVVIAGIPTKEVRQREINALKRKLGSLRYDHMNLQRKLEQQRRMCGGPSGLESETDSDGMYWSEAEQEWVSVETAIESTACSNLDLDIVELTARISADMAEAVGRARWFGLPQDSIDELVLRYGLTKY